MVDEFQFNLEFSCFKSCFFLALTLNEYYVQRKEVTPCDWKIEGNSEDFKSRYAVPSGNPK